MAFWGHIAEWGASTVAPAVVGLAMNAKEHAEQVGGQNPRTWKEKKGRSPYSLTMDAIPGWRSGCGMGS